MVFEEFVVPGPLVAGGLLVAVLAVTGALYLARPIVSQQVVLGFVPWMVSGALLHVLHRMHVALDGTVLPDTVAVLLSAPSVYLTTFVLGGLVWVAGAVVNAGADGAGSTPRTLALSGTLAGLLVAGIAAGQAAGEFTPDPVLPLAGLLLSLVLTLAVYYGLGRWHPDVLSNARYVGGLVVFAHAFDAVTTAIGIELLDAGERSTAPQFILDIAGHLPTADLLGEAWLFVLVKLLLAVAIVALFHDYADERPTEGNLFFAFVAAVGLGPGAHNFFLFAFGV